MKPLRVVLDPTILIGATKNTVEVVGKTLDLIGRGTIYVSSVMLKETKTVIAGANKAARVANQAIKLVDIIEKSRRVKQVDEIQESVKYSKDAKQEKLLNLATQKGARFILTKGNGSVLFIFEVEEKNGKIVLKKFSQIETFLGYAHDWQKAIDRGEPAPLALNLSAFSRKQSQEQSQSLSV